MHWKRLIVLLGTMLSCVYHITWANVDPEPCRHMASLVHSEFHVFVYDTGHGIEICLKHLLNQVCYETLV